jgi:hypothetical protein
MSQRWRGEELSAGRYCKVQIDFVTEALDGEELSGEKILQGANQH